jgi:long-chain acyl-CoA synthetase
VYPPTHARTRPDHPAVVAAGSGAAVTYRELDDRSVRLVRVLRAAGLGVDSRVAVISEKRAEWAEMTWALLRSGMTAVPVSPRVRPSDLGALLAETGVAAVIASGAAAAAVRDAVPPGAVALCLDGAADGFAAYGAALAAVDGGELDGECLGGRMMVTSGTTGRPKAILSPRPEGHPADARPHLGRYVSLLGLGPDMVYLSAGPTYHVSPFRFLIAVTQLGGTVIELERFDPEAALAAMARHRVTHAQFVPTMLSRMLALPAAVRDRHDLSALRVAITGAAPCPPELKRAICDWWGPVVHELYGSSESYGGTHIDPVEGLRRPGSVGRASSGRIHIVGPGGDELPAGEVGQVWFSGGPSFSYVGDDEKTSATRNPSGWTTIGDLGRLDDEGYLYLAGRRDDLIICGGVNVHPGPAEEALAAHASVREACVLGLPDADLGELPCAVVVPSGAVPLVADDLLDYCRERVGRHNSPRVVRLVDELPRNDTGKLDRKRLRAQLAS